MSEQLLRGQEVARLLNVSLATAYRWMKAGILPVVRVSGARTIRVPEAALDRWINRSTTRNQKVDTQR
jgi:excisionase family DNA binding protein